MKGKNIVLTLYNRNYIRTDWNKNFINEDFDLKIKTMSDELLKYNIKLELKRNNEITIDINSYADLLNSIKISSPDDGFMNKCIAHIIGQSQNLNLYEDIIRAVKRVAFAPETIMPDDENRKVCHNCGCGC